MKKNRTPRVKGRHLVTIQDQRWWVTLSSKGLDVRRYRQQRKRARTLTLQELVEVATGQRMLNLSA